MSPNKPYVISSYPITVALSNLYILAVTLSSFWWVSYSLIRMPSAYKFLNIIPLSCKNYKADPIYFAIVLSWTYSMF